MDDWVLKWPVFFWQKPIRFRFFEPRFPVIVMGSSGRVEEDVAPSSSLPVWRRRGGGGTVVLSPGVIVLTVGVVDPGQCETQQWGTWINQVWIESLEHLGFPRFEQQGFGDIVYQNRKLVGISVFRKGPLVLYQGSLLVDVDVSLLSQHLRLPVRQPAYRAGRSHEAFLTTLRQVGFQGSVSGLINDLQVWFSAHLANRLFMLSTGSQGIKNR